MAAPSFLDLLKNKAEREKLASKQAAEAKKTGTKARVQTAKPKRKPKAKARTQGRKKPAGQAAAARAKARGKSVGAASGDLLNESKGRFADAPRSKKGALRVGAHDNRTKVSFKGKGGLSEDAWHMDLSKASRYKVSILADYLKHVHEMNHGPLDIAARHAVAMIRSRTLLGISDTGAPFKGLSASYTGAKLKMQRYLPGAPGPTVPPPAANLFLSGALYRSIGAWRRTKGGQPGLSVGVHSNKGFAERVIKGSGNTPARPFIGLSPDQEGILTREFMKNLDRGLRDRMK